MTSTIPFIVRFGEQRESTEKCPGSYCFPKDVRMVRERGILIPLINSQSTVHETKTITKVERERED